MMKDTATFWNATADNLRAARAALRWTQRELAARAGVHYKSVAYWERRAGRIGGHAVKRFKEAMQAAGYQFPVNGSQIAVEAPSRPIVIPPARCGAKTRKGSLCGCKPVAGKSRCKFHGGLSTGPKTQEGRERIANAQRLRWKCYGLDPVAASLVRSFHQGQAG